MRRVAVRGIVFREGKLLCVKLKPYQEVITGDYWCVPGGSVDEGEALIPALEREIIEETGITPEIGPLLYIQQFMHGEREVLEFFFHVKNAGDYLDIDLVSTSHGSKEIEKIAFIDPATTNILPKFLTSQDLQEKIVSQSPATIFSLIR